MSQEKTFEEWLSIFVGGCIVAPAAIAVIIMLLMILMIVAICTPFAALIWPEILGQKEEADEIA